jgi:hypothetical protein
MDVPARVSICADDFINAVAGVIVGGGCLGRAVNGKGGQAVVLSLPTNRPTTIRRHGKNPSSFGSKARVPLDLSSL